MSLGREIVDIAEREVGVREVGGNNQGPRVEVYQRMTWLHPAPWPWCAAFTCWVLAQALQTPAGAVTLSQLGTTLGSFRCKDASAFGWIKWAKKHNLIVFDEHSDLHLPAAGDFVVFDFSHIGIVSRNFGQGATTAEPTEIHTIEGNTNGKGERDSQSGDGVWRKVRNINLVRAYIRVEREPQGSLL